MWYRIWPLRYRFWPVRYRISPKRYGQILSQKRGIESGLWGISSGPYNLIRKSWSDSIPLYWDRIWSDLFGKTLYLTGKIIWYSDICSPDTCSPVETRRSNNRFKIFNNFNSTGGQISGEQVSPKRYGQRPIKTWSWLIYYYWLEFGMENWFLRNLKFELYT